MASKPTDGLEGGHAPSLPARQSPAGPLPPREGGTAPLPALVAPEPSPASRAAAPSGGHAHPLTAPVRASALRLLLGLAALALLGGAGVLLRPAGRVHAQAGFDESDCVEVTPEQLGNGTDPQFKSKRLKMTGKILAIQGPTIALRQNQDLACTLADALAKAGVLDIQKINEGDNVRLYGYLNTEKNRPTYFLIMNVLKQADDLKQWKDDIARLSQAGDVAALMKLGERITAEAQAQRRDQQWKPLAREAYRAAVQLREKSAKEDDSATWVQIAGDYFRLIGDRQAALERLVKAIRPGDPLIPPDVKKLLSDIDAYYYAGEYVLFEEMKRREGFVERDGKWILRERFEFEQRVEERLKSRATLRKELKESYELQARSGDTALGMNKSEVVLAVGFPDDVDRRRMGSDTFDAWTYEGRGIFYFDNDILFKKPDGPR